MNGVKCIITVKFGRRAHALLPRSVFLVARTIRARTAAAMHRLLRHIAVADITIPYPVVVALELLGYGGVRRIGRGVFAVGAVVAGFAVNPVVHTAGRSVLEH